MSAEQILTWYRRAVAEKRDEHAARRARVLRYPDLAARLTEPPLRFPRPTQWSGYIPPRVLAEDTCPRCPAGCVNREHTAKVNASPERRALVEIASEALRREQGTQEQLSERAG